MMLKSLARMSEAFSISVITRPGTSCTYPVLTNVTCTVYCEIILQYYIRSVDHAMDEIGNPDSVSDSWVRPRSNAPSHSRRPCNA